MSTFDPAKPCQYRCGEEPLAVFVLPSKLGWIGIVSLRENEECLKHYRDGRLFQSTESCYDLINIPEEVEVVRWAVLDAAGTWMNSFVEENKARAWAGTSCTVVRLTGTYTR